MRVRHFTGAHGNLIVGEETGPPSGRPVIMLHGGGQTRHAWREGGSRLAKNGFCIIRVDQRGHGESGWDAEGRYRCADFSADLVRILRQMPDDPDNRPVVVGASLGGLAAMLVAGGAGADLLAGIVLVDITPHVNADGVDRITGFMQTHAGNGFASVEEAADAVAAYLPHRPRPDSTGGLLKNLRQTADGRYVWHWDPKFLSGDQAIDSNRADVQRRLVDAVRQILVPIMLVRGSRSELVDDSHVADFSRLAPHAEIADVRGAGHMVAGDRNDVFVDAVEDFLNRHFRAANSRL